MSNQIDDLVFYAGKRCLDNMFYVTWIMTGVCNFNCPYCWPNFKPIKTNADPIKIIDFILNNTPQNIMIIITGGEPTTHPTFLENIKYLIEQSKIKNKTIEINLRSNLSKHVEYYDEFFKLNEEYSNIKLSLFSSFHRDDISVHDYLEKIKYLVSKKYTIDSFAYMIYHDDCIDIINSVKNELINVPFILTPINEYTLDYTKIDPALVSNSDVPKRYAIYYKNNEYYYDTPRLRNLSFKKFVCSSFKSRLTIDCNGEMIQCRLIDNNNKTLNVLSDESTEYLKNHEYLICPIKNCFCGDYIPKIKMTHFNKLKDINEEYILENIKKLEE